jgi:hypothetical protein
MHSAHTLPETRNPIEKTGTTSVEADASLMRICSGVARDLPADAAVWDLRHLLFDGEPVERITVIRWLNLCYMSVYGRPFEQQTPQQSTALSANELYQLLAFADAINSTKGPLVTKTRTAELEQLSMQVSLEGGAVQLMMDGRPYWFCRRRAAGQTQLMFSMKLLRSTNAMTAFAAEVAAQCEQLLLMAHKLQLDQLLQWIRRFVAQRQSPQLQAALTAPSRCYLPTYSAQQYTAHVCMKQLATQHSRDKQHGLLIRQAAAATCACLAT